MDLAKKRRIKSAVSWIAVVGIVAVFAGISLLDQRGADTGIDGEVKTAAAERGDLSLSLRGGGKLVQQEPAKMELPEGVEISEYLVQNGEAVQEGQAIARVDELSLDQTILTVNEAMMKTLAKIDAQQTSGAAETLTSPVSGRIKEIYVLEGEDVRTSLLRDGALLLLSLDGRLQVRLETESSLVPGDVVELRLADSKVQPLEGTSLEGTSPEGTSLEGTSLEGRVESNLAGELVITAADEGYALGQEIQVYHQDKPLGTGILEAHDAWKLMAAEGTVSRIRVQKEQVVEKGDTLFEMNTALGASADLLDQYEQYRQVLLELFELKQTGTVLSPTEGKVEGLDAEKTALARPRVEAGALSLTIMGAGEVPEGSSAEGEAPAPADTGSGESQTADPTQELTSQILTMLLTGQYTGYIGIFTGASADQAGALIQPEGFALDQPLALLSMRPDFTKMTTPVVFSSAIAFYEITGGQMRTADPAVLTAGTPLILLKDAAGVEQMVILLPDVTGALTPGEDPAAMPDLSSLTPEQIQQLLAIAGQGQIPGLAVESLIGSYGGFDISSLYGLDFSGMMGEETQEEAYENTPWTLGRVVPQEWMEVSMPVDEQDLSLISEGSQVQVYVEALNAGSQDRTPLKGEIRKISRKGSNQGGSSKFNVIIRLPREEGMLEGMSASCVIPVEEKKDLLLIPVEALMEDGGRLYVYTGYDPQKQMFLSPVDVTIGFSDEEKVEILSGLTEGMMVYYSVLTGEEF